MSTIITLDSNNRMLRDGHAWIITEPCLLYGTSEPFTKLRILEWQGYEPTIREFADESEFPLEVLWRPHIHSVANIQIDTEHKCYVKLYIEKRQDSAKIKRKIKRRKKDRTDPHVVYVPENAPRPIE
jgi:hypothetical protein